MPLIKTKLKQTFIEMTWFDIKWSEKGWYIVNQPTNQPKRLGRFFFEFFSEIQVVSFKNWTYFTDSTSTGDKRYTTNDTDTGSKNLTTGSEWTYEQWQWKGNPGTLRAQYRGFITGCMLFSYSGPRI